MSVKKRRKKEVTENTWLSLFFLTQYLVSAGPIRWAAWGMVSELGQVTPKPQNDWSGGGRGGGRVGLDLEQTGGRKLSASWVGRPGDRAAPRAQR